MPPDANDRRRLPEALRGEWNEQLLRTRQLLDGSEDEAVEGVLAPLGDRAEMEAWIAAELAVDTPLAERAVSRRPTDG